MEPVLTAVVAWAEVRLKSTCEKAVSAAVLEKAVADKTWPEVKELAVKDKASVEVTEEEMAVAPKPVKAMAPEVAVRERAPVVKVRPFPAVRRPAKVPVPVPVAEMLPEVVMASPALMGDKVVPVLFHQP